MFYLLFGMQQKFKSLQNSTPIGTEEDWTIRRSYITIMSRNKGTLAANRWVLLRPDGSRIV